MKRVRLGVYIPDREYKERFTSCLVNHYRQQMELHIYTEKEALREAAGELDVVVMEPCAEEAAGLSCPAVCLCEPDQAVGENPKGVCMVEKYQEVNRIVDEIMKQVGEEIRDSSTGDGSVKPQFLAVYALSENEYQLPLAVTLASILGEQERVLLVDLQENSGFSQLAGEVRGQGMEELLVMAESGKYAPGRMVSCIGHIDGADYVYPVKNSECLCETEGEVYRNLIGVLAREMDYRIVVLSFGSRFVGFFDLLKECREIYLVKGRGGLAQWRQKEFLAEMEAHGCERLEELIHEIELPVLASPAISCERLVEQWKWNDFGDRIRNMMPGVMTGG